MQAPAPTECCRADRAWPTHKMDKHENLHVHTWMFTVVTQQDLQHYRIKQCTLCFVWQHSLEHFDRNNMKINELRQSSVSLRSASCKLHTFLFHDNAASLGTKCSSTNLCANSSALRRCGNSRWINFSISFNTHLSSGIQHDPEETL